MMFMLNIFSVTSVGPHHFLENLIQVLSLPMFPELSEAQIAEVVSQVDSFLKR